MQCKKLSKQVRQLSRNYKFFYKSKKSRYCEVYSGGIFLSFLSNWTKVIWFSKHIFSRLSSLKKTSVAKPCKTFLRKTDKKILHLAIPDYLCPITYHQFYRKNTSFCDVNHLTIIFQSL